MLSLRTINGILAAGAVAMAALIAAEASAISFTNDRSSVLTEGSPSTEATLADEITAAGYTGGFAAGDQTTNAFFQPLEEMAFSSIIIEHAGYRHHNELGIYNPDGIEVMLFSGSDSAGAASTLAFGGGDMIVDGTLYAGFGDTFGFYMRNDNVGFTWYSDDSANPSGNAHFLGFEEWGTLYFGFEDLDLGDHDYNDLIAMVSGITGAGAPLLLLPSEIPIPGLEGNGPLGGPIGTPVPEPTAALVFAAGLIVVGASQRRRNR